MPRRKKEDDEKPAEELPAKRTRSTRNSNNNNNPEPPVVEKEKELTFEEASQPISGNKLKQMSIGQLHRICNALQIEAPKNKGKTVEALNNYYNKAQADQYRKQQQDDFDAFVATHPIVANREVRGNAKMDINILKVDPIRPYIYGLSQGENMSNDAFLYVFDKSDGKLIRKLNVGANATGMDLTFPNKESLYVTNCGIPHEGVHYNSYELFFKHLLENGVEYRIRKVDLENFTVTDTAFSGHDLCHIACVAGGAVVEGRDQWVSRYYFNFSSNDELKGHRTLRAGRCVASPEGFIYHLDHNSSDSKITKCEVKEEVQEITSSESKSACFPELVMSGNGERFFIWPSSGLDSEHSWYTQDSFVYNKNLEQIATLQHEILAANFTGDIVVSENAILFLNGEFKVEREQSLPFSTKVMCVDNDKVWLYNKETDEIVPVTIA